MWTVPRLRSIATTALLAASCHAAATTPGPEEAPAPVADAAAPAADRAPAQDAPAGAVAPVAGVDGPAARGDTAARASDAAVAAGAVHVLTQRYSNARLGWNPAEAILNTGNVNARQFGRLFARKVDGQIWAQPLYVSGLDTGARGRRNVVFVGTSTNKVYAFDADDPAMGDPLWTTSLGTPAIMAPLCSYCQDFNPYVGITSAPVIDLAARTLYVTSKHLDGDAYRYRLSALDLVTGAHRPGSPIVISASVPGKAGDAVGGMVTFDAKRQFNRAALLLSGGLVFVGFGSHGDIAPYHGWVLAYDAATLKPAGAFNATPDGASAGIWQGSQGLAADERGIVYLVTGNGTSLPNDARPQLGESVVALQAAGGELKVVDWYMAGNHPELNAADVDLGSSGLLLVPRTNLLLLGAKQKAYGYLLDRTNLGHFRADDSQVVQKFDGTAPDVWTGGHFTGFVYWESPQGPTVFAWPTTSRLLGFRLQPEGKVDPVPAVVGTFRLPAGAGQIPAAVITISSSGSAPGSGILWASHAVNQDPRLTVPGVLHAFDATTLKELWNSLEQKDRDDLGNFAKYTPPVVVNGKVYQATFSDQLVVYGLLGGGK